METEEEIYHHLYNKDRTAVFIQLYNPGHFLSEYFNRTFEIESARPEYVQFISFNYWPSIGMTI
jgi:hypothetical protein